MVLQNHDSTELKNSQLIIDHKNYFVVPNDIHLIIDTLEQLSVLLYLMRCTNDKNLAYPKQTIIARELMSRTKVNSTLKELEEKGFITSYSRNNTSKLYEVNINNILNAIDNLKPPKTQAVVSSV